MVGRLDEGATDIMVADDPQLERDAALLGVAHRRRHAGIRHWHNDIGRHARFTRQFRTDLLACVVDRLAFHDRVRTREIDVFEYAEPLARATEGLYRVHALVVDHHNLARLDVSDEFGPDDIQR